MTAYADPVAQAEVERLRARVAELEAHEQRVRDLHPDVHWCTDAEGQHVHFMAEMGEVCPTIAALDGVSDPGPRSSDWAQLESGTE